MFAAQPSMRNQRSPRKSSQTCERCTRQAAWDPSPLRTKLDRKCRARAIAGDGRCCQQSAPWRIDAVRAAHSSAA